MTINTKITNALTPVDNPVKKETEEVTERMKCLQNGGKWDAETGTCSFGKEEDEQTIPGETETGRKSRTKEQIASDLNISLSELEALYDKNREEFNQNKLQEDKSAFGALRDSETGRLSGFKQGGETYLGLDPIETRAALELEAGRQELQVGGQASQQHET